MEVLCTVLAPGSANAVGLRELNTMSPGNLISPTCLVSQPDLLIPWLAENILKLAALPPGQSK